MANLTTTNEVTKALGGRQAVAELTGRSPHVVSNWMIANRGRFPKDTVLVLQAALQEKGHTAPFSLWGMPEPKAPSGKKGRAKRSPSPFLVIRKADPASAGDAA